MAEAYYFLGLLYSLAEKFPEAVEHLKTALAIFEDYEILDRLAQSYSQLGIVEETAVEYTSALKAFTASQKINEEIGEDLNRAREFRKIEKIYSLRFNRFNEAKESFSRLMTCSLNWSKRNFRLSCYWTWDWLPKRKGILTDP